MASTHTPTEAQKAAAAAYAAMSTPEKIAHTEALLAKNPPGPIAVRLRERLEKLKPKDTTFTVISYGMVCASVCTSLTNEEAAARLNEEVPTGIKSKWDISEDTHFAGGKHTNPCACPDFPGNRHILFKC